MPLSKKKNVQRMKLIRLRKRLAKPQKSIIVQPVRLEIDADGQPIYEVE